MSTGQVIAISVGASVVTTFALLLWAVKVGLPLIDQDFAAQLRANQ